MKIVLVNRYFYPDQSATSRMISSLAFGLVRAGFHVTALASRSRYDGGASALPPHERLDGVEIHRLQASRFGKGLAARSADYATFHVAAAAWLSANVGRSDICVVCTDPPLLAVSAALPIRLRGAHLVNWVMDLFPETAMELGVVSRPGLTARSMLALRDRSLRSSALTICPIEAMTRYLHPRAGRSGVVTVRHWANDTEIRPVDRFRNRLRQAWDLRDRFVVGYSGNFGRAHEFTTLLAAADLLRDDATVRFLMIGDGPQRRQVEAEAQRLHLPNILFKPYQPSSDLAESLSASDVHIVSLLPSLEHCIIPSKLYGILAAGRPTLFIGDSSGETGSVLRNAGCGYTVAPGDPAALARRIVELRETPELCASMGGRALSLFRNEYALEAGIARWIAAVRHLLPQPHIVAVEAQTSEVAA